MCDVRDDGGWEGGGEGEEPDEEKPPLEGDSLEQHGEGCHHCHISVQCYHQQTVHTTTQKTQCNTD